MFTIEFNHFALGGLRYDVQFGVHRERTRKKEQNHCDIDKLGGGNRIIVLMSYVLGPYSTILLHLEK